MSWKWITVAPKIENSELILCYPCSPHTESVSATNMVHVHCTSMADVSVCVQQHTIPFDLDSGRFLTDDKRIFSEWIIPMVFVGFRMLINTNENNNFKKGSNSCCFVLKKMFLASQVQFWMGLFVFYFVCMSLRNM